MLDVRSPTLDVTAARRCQARMGDSMSTMQSGCVWRRGHQWPCGPADPLPAGYAHAINITGRLRAEAVNEVGITPGRVPLCSGCKGGTSHQSLGRHCCRSSPRGHHCRGCRCRGAPRHSSHHHSSHRHSSRRGCSSPHGCPHCGPHPGHCGSSLRLHTIELLCGPST